jgi:hypothetical protein
MNKTIIALFLCISTTVSAQTIQLFELTRQMRCAAVDTLIAHLMEAYGEKVVWVGKDRNNGTYVSLFKNEATGTWTMIQYDTRTGCVLSAGELGTPI